MNTDIQIQPDATESVYRLHGPVEVRSTRLTERENELVQYAVAGNSTKAIARAMSIGEATVRAERARLKREILQVRALLDKIGQR